MTILQTDEQAQGWLRALDQTARHHLVDTRGPRVMWREFGKGSPLILIHGGHGSWMHWARNIQALSAHFTLFVPDLAGYGDSSTPDFQELPAMVDTTIESLNQVVGANTPLKIAGFSFGGLITANIAVQRPQVERIALLGPGGHGSTQRPRGEMVNWKKALDEASRSAALKHNLWAHMLHADEAIDALALRAHTDSCVQTRFRSRPLSARGTLAQTLDAYEKNALIIWGEHDVTTAPDEMMMRLVTGRANRQGVILPGAGHWIQYEASEPVNERLIVWFRN